VFSSLTIFTSRKLSALKRDLYYLFILEF
jgi:hypothetical protein